MAAPRHDTTEQITRMADAGQRAANDTARAAQAVANEAAKASEQAVRAGADVLQKAVETTSEALETGLKGASTMVRRLSDQFTSALVPADERTEELARKSSQNIEAVSEASTILARGMQDASREWFGLLQERWEKNLDGVKELVRCRSVPDLMAVQSELMRDSLEQAIATSRRVAELTLRVANEATRRTDRARRAA